MKKVLLSAMLLLMSAGVLGAAPVLFEAFQEGTITIPTDESDTLTVAEVSFSVDSACYAQFATGGLAKNAQLGLVLDGESLPPVARVTVNSRGFVMPFTLIYTYLLDPGEHTTFLQLINYWNASSSTVCSDAYLQALIFLPDTATNAVAEPPVGDAEPSVNTPSLISKGPYVNVQGASELVDATGRVIEDAISEDKVFISNLPTGTYFARNGERTIVKIVKVD